MKKKLIVLSLLFIFSVMIRLFNLYQAGRTYDEIAYVSPGYTFVNLFKKGDFNSPLWWNYPDEPPLARYIYGLGAEFDYQTTNHKGQAQFAYDLPFSRAESVLFSSLSVVLVAGIGWEFINLSVGISAGCILALLPFFLGFSQLATLESLIMFFFTASIYLYLKILKNYSLKKVVLLGIVIGLAISIKPTNLLILPTLFLLYTNWYLMHIGSTQIKRKKDKFIALLLASGIAVIAFFALWPMALLHLEYIAAFTKNLRFSTQYSIPEVFFGKIHLTPIYYYIVLFCITTPAVILLLFGIGILKTQRNKSWILISLIIWFICPFLQSFNHMRQQGVRYIIEIYAPLSLLAAVGFYAIIPKRKYAVLVCAVLLIGYLLYSDYKVSPYYIDYFNELVGGPGGVQSSKLSQLGWWGEGTKEAINYLARTAPNKATIAIVGNQLPLAPSIKNRSISSYNKNKKYDYIVLHYYTLAREGFDDTEIKKQYTLIHTIKVDKAVLVYIYIQSQLKH